MDAYRFAENEPDEDGRYPPMPFELVLLGYIQQFGVKAVTGRDELSAGDIRRMTVADNIRTAYQSRKSASRAKEGWAKWAEEYPQYDAWLKEIEMLIYGAN